MEARFWVEKSGQVGILGVVLQFRTADCVTRNLVQDPTETQPLGDFWQAHRLDDQEDLQDEAVQVESPSVDRLKRNQGQPSSNGQMRIRDRTVSTVPALVAPGHMLSPHHPALSLPVFLDTFGPLIFPLYKAALLRKRILLVGQAPVELACNFGKCPLCCCLY